MWFNCSHDRFNFKSSFTELQRLLPDLAQERAYDPSARDLELCPHLAAIC